MAIRRTFQALRIAVNNEFSALEALLRVVPGCLKPRGRVAILSFIRAKIGALKRHLQPDLPLVI